MACTYLEINACNMLLSWPQHVIGLAQLMARGCHRRSLRKYACRHSVEFAGRYLS